MPINSAQLVTLRENFKSESSTDFKEHLSAISTELGDKRKDVKGFSDFVLEVNEEGFDFDSKGSALMDFFDALFAAKKTLGDDILDVTKDKFLDEAGWKDSGLDGDAILHTEDLKTLDINSQSYNEKFAELAQGAGVEAFGNKALTDQIVTKEEDGKLKVILPKELFAAYNTYKEGLAEGQEDEILNGLKGFISAKKEEATKGEELPEQTSGQQEEKSIGKDIEEATSLKDLRAIVKDHEVGTKGMTVRGEKGLTDRWTQGHGQDNISFGDNSTVLTQEARQIEKLEAKRDGELGHLDKMMESINHAIVKNVNEHSDNETLFGDLNASAAIRKAGKSMLGGTTFTEEQQALVNGTEDTPGLKDDLKAKDGKFSPVDMNKYESLFTDGQNKDLKSALEKRNARVDEIQAVKDKYNGKAAVEERKDESGQIITSGSEAVPGLLTPHLESAKAKILEKHNLNEYNQSSEKKDLDQAGKDVVSQIVEQDKGSKKTVSLAGAMSSIRNVGKSSENFGDYSYEVDSLKPGNHIKHDSQRKEADKGKDPSVDLTPEGLKALSEKIFDKLNSKDGSFDTETAKESMKKFRSSGKMGNSEFSKLVGGACDENDEALYLEKCPKLLQSLVKEQYSSANGLTEGRDGLTHDESKQTISQAMGSLSDAYKKLVDPSQETVYSKYAASHEDRLVKETESKDKSQGATDFYGVGRKVSNLAEEVGAGISNNASVVPQMIGGTVAAGVGIAAGVVGAIGAVGVGVVTAGEVVEESVTGRRQRAADKGQNKDAVEDIFSAGNETSSESSIKSTDSSVSSGFLAGKIRDQVKGVIDNMSKGSTNKDDSTVSTLSRSDSENSLDTIPNVSNRGGGRSN